MSKHKHKTITHKQLANLKFKGIKDTGSLMSRQEWNEMAENEYRLMSAIGPLSQYDNKKLAEIYAKEPEAMFELLQCIGSQLKRYKDGVEVFQAMEIRLCAAASKWIEQTDKKSKAA